MLKDKLKSSFGLSLILHIAVLVIAFGSLGFMHSKPKTIQVNLHPDAKPEQQIVKAGVINKKAVDQAYQRQLLAEKAREQKIAEEKKQAELARLETERLKKESAAAKKALDLAKAQKATAEAEAKKLKLAQEKSKKELLKQQAQAKAVAKQHELARKQAAEKKAAAIKAEQEKLRAQHDSFIQDEVQRYVAEFAQAIEDNRILSSIFAGDISCRIRIQLLPDGTILSAGVVESSGNPAYDEMSKAAVFKTAPFPMPEDKELYAQLRDIILTFRNGEQDVL